MRVAWLAPYPVQLLAPPLQLARRLPSFHPCSWIVNLSNRLSVRAEIELHIVTGSSLVARDQVVSLNGITFHVCKIAVPFTQRGLPPYLPLDALTGFHFPVRRFVRELGEIQPDLVHAHGTEAAFALAGVKSGFPCLISMQGVIHEIVKIAPSFAFHLAKQSEAEAVRRGRYFACRTDFDTGFVSSLNSQARIFTIHEAINPAFFRTDWAVNDSQGILFVGTWVRRKGLETLCEAMAQVKKVLPDASLQLIGAGSDRYVQHLKNLCTRLGVEQQVNFVGFKLPEDVVGYHLGSQVFVLPSESENSPNTIAEAMVSGMPVIATRVGGIPSMIENGVTGLLVEPNNPIELADKIVYLLTHPKERARLGGNAQPVARKRHLPDTVAEQTMHAYKEIVKLERA